MEKTSDDAKKKAQLILLNNEQVGMERVLQDQKLKLKLARQSLRASTWTFIKAVLILVLTAAFCTVILGASIGLAYRIFQWITN